MQDGKNLELVIKKELLDEFCQINDFITALIAYGFIGVVLFCSFFIYPLVVVPKDSRKKLLGLIPGLENAEIVRYGVMHRNTYINSTKVLNNGFQFRSNKNIFFAGQMTGVEGYVESAASGLLAGINMARYLDGKENLSLDSKTAIGSLANYISYYHNGETGVDRFDPMNVNFGIFEPLNIKVGKKERKSAYANRALGIIDELVKEL